MSMISIPMILEAYSQGYFPMGREGSATEIDWYSATRRGIIPLDGFHVSKKVRRMMRTKGYIKRINQDFEGVIHGCANRESTWINETIKDIFIRLHTIGLAQSIEVWKDDTLCGGLYGLSLGGTFFAESVFQNEPECMKLALGYCHQELVERGFTLWDVQFRNDFLKQFGCIEISPVKYQRLLDQALIGEVESFRQPKIHISFNA